MTWTEMGYRLVRKCELTVQPVEETGRYWEGGVPRMDRSEQKVICKVEK